MNNHLYSVDYILLTLRLVIKHLNFDEEDIFRYGSDIDQPPLEALKDYISLILAQKKSEDSLPQFISDFNHNPENIKKKIAISDNTWSKLSQEVMIHGCLFDKYNLRVNAAWTLLCNALYIPWSLLDNSTALSNKVQAKSKTFSTYLEENKFQLFFNEFLNTLCAIGYEQTAEAFHLFLYITYLVTLHAEANQTTPEGIANIQSICLTNGLELEGVLSKIDSLDQSKLHYSALFKQENVLFSQMVHHLINCDQFKKPFSIEDYQSGLTAEFKPTLEAIMLKNWSQPNITAVPYSHDIFGEIPESNCYVSPLPIIEDNSETATDELRSRSQSPRSQKKSFELFRKKAAKSEDLPSRIRKTSTEKPQQTDKDKKNADKSRMHSSTPNLTHEKKSFPSKNVTLEVPTEKEFKSSSPRSNKQKPVLPLLKLPSTGPNNAPQKKSPVSNSPHTPDKVKPESSPRTVTFRSYSSHSSSSEKSHDEHPSKPELSLKELLGIPDHINELTKLPTESNHVPQKKSPVSNSPRTPDKVKPESSPRTVTFRSSSSEKNNEELPIKEFFGIPDDINELTKMLKDLECRESSSDSESTPDDEQKVIYNLHSRSQSPRHPTYVRSKRSFDGPSTRRKTSTEIPLSVDKDNDKKMVPTGKSRIHSSLPNLNNERRNTISEPQSKTEHLKEQEPKKNSAHPPHKFTSTESERAHAPQRRKSPVHNNSLPALDSDKPKIQISNIVSNSPYSEINCDAHLGSQGELDELAKILQSLTFNEKVSDETEETDDTNDFYHRRKTSKERRSQPTSPKKKDEHKSEGEPLLYQYTLIPDSEKPTAKKTLKRHQSKSKLTPSSTQNPSLK